MNRNDLPKVVQDKTSGYTWIKLGQLKIEEKINLTIQTNDSNSNCVHEIESKGYQLFPILENRYSVMRTINGTATMCQINDLVNLANIECIISIEVSAPLGIRDKNS